MKQSIYFLIVGFLISSCSKKPESIDPIPNHQTIKIDSRIVNEKRVINIWTPPNYDRNDLSYPVLYMPDGGIKEDFPHIANTLAKLIENKSIPPLILVGIENTDRRRDLSGFSEVEEDAKYCPLTDGAKDFRSFITNELMPEISKTYKTTGKKGIIGESLAGLFVLETFFTTPKEFDFYIAMDPSIWWNNHYIERKAANFLKEFPDKEAKLWFAGSRAEDISQFTNKVASTLKEYAPKTLIWKYSNEPNEKHNTIFRATKEKALMWSLNEVE